LQKKVERWTPQEVRVVYRRIAKQSMFKTDKDVKLAKAQEKGQEKTGVEKNKTTI